MGEKWQASTAFIEPISKLLKSLQLNKSIAHLSISSNGIKVYTFAPSRSHYCQLFLDSSLFATYQFSGEEEVSLKLSLSALVHSLQIFMEWTPSDDYNSSFAGCFFEYTVGKNFQVSFANDTMNSVCDLTVFEKEGNGTEHEIPFGVDQIVLQVILPSQVFASILQDLSAVNGQEISFIVNVDPPQLEVCGVGDLASTQFVLPNEPNVLDALAAESNGTFTYDFKSVAKCREAVRLAKRISLRFDSSGTLSVQCLCEIDDHSSYIEMRFLSKI